MKTASGWMNSVSLTLMRPEPPGPATATVSPSAMPMPAAADRFIQSTFSGICLKSSGLFTVWPSTCRLQPPMVSRKLPAAGLGVAV